MVVLVAQLEEWKKGEKRRVRTSRAELMDGRAMTLNYAQLQERNALLLKTIEEKEEIIR